MPGVIDLVPSGDPSGALDQAAIEAAFAGADSDTIVRLGPGDWFTSDALNVPDQVELCGWGAGVNGVTSTSPSGTVIHPVESFAGGEVIGLANGNQGNRIRHLAIINDQGDGTGPGVDGITLHGNVNGTLLEHLSIKGVTGHGVACTQIDGDDADGMWMHR